MSAINKYIAIGGRFLFGLGFTGFGINHFRKTDKISGYIPEYLPAPDIWVYVTGIIMIVCGLALALGIKTRIFGYILAAMIFVFMILLYIPDAMHNKMAIVVYSTMIGGILYISSRSSE